MTADLSPALLDLMEHEKAIEQGLAEIGWHLEAIRDGRKYRAAGFATFEDYCQKRWHKRRSWADRQITAHGIIRELTPNGVTGPGGLQPESEGQVRPLVALRDDPDALGAAWRAAVERAGGDQPTAVEVAAAVREVRIPQPVNKRDLGGGVVHPAPYTPALLPIFAELLDGYRRVLDPFAGTGRVHQLARFDHETVGVELEPEWAGLHPDTVVGSATELPYGGATFDAICTSPTYGNRFADAGYSADPEARRSYTYDLGRTLHPDNTGGVYWGRNYRAMHVAAWREAVRVLRPGGRFVLNIKDHVRDGRWQDVAGWHVAELVRCGLTVVAVRPVPTRGHPIGGTGDVRVGAELVIALDKGDR